MCSQSVYCNNYEIYFKEWYWWNSLVLYISSDHSKKHLKNYRFKEHSKKSLSFKASKKTIIYKNTWKIIASFSNWETGHCSPKIFSMISRKSDLGRKLGLSFLKYWMKSYRMKKVPAKDSCQKLILKAENCAWDLPDSDEKNTCLAQGEQVYPRDVRSSCKGSKLACFLIGWQEFSSTLCYLFSDWSKAPIEQVPNQTKHSV